MLIKKNKIVTLVVLLLLVIVGFVFHTSTQEIEEPPIQADRTETRTESFGEPEAVL